MACVSVLIATHCMSPGCGHRHRPRNSVPSAHSKGRREARAVGTDSRGIWWRGYGYRRDCQVAQPQHHRHCRCERLLMLLPHRKRGSSIMASSTIVVAPITGSDAGVKQLHAMGVAHILNHASQDVIAEVPCVPLTVMLSIPERVLHGCLMLPAFVCSRLPSPAVWACTLWSKWRLTRTLVET